MGSKDQLRSLRSASAWFKSHRGRCVYKYNSAPTAPILRIWNWDCHYLHRISGIEARNYIHRIWKFIHRIFISPMDGLSKPRQPKHITCFTLGCSEKKKQGMWPKFNGAPFFSLDFAKSFHGEIHVRKKSKVEDNCQENLRYLRVPFNAIVSQEIKPYWGIIKALLVAKKLKVEVISIAGISFAKQTLPKLKASFCLASSCLFPQVMGGATVQFPNGVAVSEIDAVYFHICFCVQHPPAKHQDIWDMSLRRINLFFECKKTWISPRKLGSKVRINGL